MIKRFCILLLLISSGVTSQVLEVDYKVTDFQFQIPDKFKDHPGYHSIKKRYQNISAYANDINFKLKINEKHSLFSSIKILEPPRDIGNSIKSGLISMNLHGAFYCSQLDEKLYHKTTISGEEFTLISNFSDRQWDLQKETKQILQKRCFKATTTDTIKNSKGIFLKKITAWYYPEIPLNFGPGPYTGLPGIVLGIDVQESNKYYTIEAFKIKNVKKLDVDFKIVNPTTKKELDSLLAARKKILRDY